MALRITDDCIECLACLEVCPLQAISTSHAAAVGIARVTIDPAACSHCSPLDRHPRCARVCPVDCIVVDPKRPVPPAHLIRRELEQLLSVVGPFEVARTIVRMRQWVREWFEEAVRSSTGSVDADQILDFYSFLGLIEREYSSSYRAPELTNTPPRDQSRMSV